VFTRKPGSAHSWRSIERIYFQPSVIGQSWKPSCATHSNSLQASVTNKRVCVFHYIGKIGWARL
jgi:hypothetical protein